MSKGISTTGVGARVRGGLLALLLAGGIMAAAPAVAQVRGSGWELPLTLANEAALEAVRACAEKGWPVSVAVVDVSGEIRVLVKGDHSTTHTRTSSFRKAYTVATLGPVFGFDTLSAFVEKTRGGPNTQALASLPDILLLAGGVGVKAKGEIVAAIGVGGAPGGEKDEACAAAGLARIADRLPH
ncbi:heme-binding protein [Xanthobacter autotrophicus]|uniref:GlcG/HbpS family heme-binding protein n=1 Tax=Xanthobacter autotrophicus TaxID=280 RepID=UPI003729FB6C